MNQLITMETIKAGKSGQEVSGVILCKNYNIALTKNGKEYVVGELQSGEVIGFKAWNSSSAFSKFKEEDYSGIPVYISGSFDEYNGVLSIVLNSIQAVEGFTVDLFLPVKYNIEAYWQGLVDIIKNNVSSKGFDFINKIFFSNEDIVNRFKLEFAASSHHDNCKGGLLAHTYKVLMCVNFLTRNYPAICNNVETHEKSEDFSDLLYIGALLHDIGKIDEMHIGVYQPNSSVTHRFLGLEYIVGYKDEIINLYSEKWYYDLVSIFLQHHGEYDDKCRTLASYIVFMADLWESRFTSLVESLEKPQTGSSGLKIKAEDYYLTI